MIQINPLKSYIDGGVRAAITTPPSASLVFDLPGKAIWVKGVKLKGTDHTYTFSHDNYITLTNTSNSNESEDIKIGVNTSALKNAIDTTYGVVSTTTNGLAPKFTSENKLAASAATTYYFLGWTGSTLKWYQAPFRNVRINSETTDRLGVNNTDPLIISSGNGISVTWDSTNKKIVITNTQPDVNHNTHYTTMLYIGENNDTKANKNVANPYLKLFDDNTRRATFQIKAGSGIAVASDANGNITITNSSPDVNHNTDRTGIKLTTVSGTKKTDSTLILANSTTGLNIQGGTNKFLIGDGTNYIEVPVTPSFTISNKDATIGTALTTIATIAGVDIKAKIASYSLSNHTHSVTINGSTKTITTSGTVDLGNYLPLSGGTMNGTAWIRWADSGNISNNNEGVTFPVIRGGLQWNGQTDYVKLFSEETGRDNLNLVLQFGDDNSNGLSIRDKSNAQTSYISSSGVITTGTFKGNLDWSYITNKPSSYTPSAHTHTWNSLTHSSTTENQAILTNGSTNGWKLYTLNISGWNNAANNAHSHSNKSVLDGITSTLVSNWNTAYNFVNTISGTDTDKVINKWDEIVNFLAGISEDDKLNTLLNSKLSVYELANNTNVGVIKNNGIYYSTSDASSGTLTNSPFNTGFTLINMTSYDGGDDLRRSRLAFNAYGEIKVSNDRGYANTAETWYNVLTSNNSGISGSTIKLNGTSITVYSSSTADNKYVKKAGDTMFGTLAIDTTGFGALVIKRNDDANGASIQFRGKSNVYGYIGLNNSTKDKQFLRWDSSASITYTILDTSSTYVSSGKGIINGITITQVDNASNATNATNSTNARKLVNWYSTRPTSLNTQFGDGSLRIFYATSSTTEGKSPSDAAVLHLAWDNNGGWDTQLGISSPSGRIYSRGQNAGTWQSWKTLAFTTDIPTSLKNPYALTISLNGVSQGPYDGSAAKNINITPSSIGASSSSHTHSYLPLSGGTMTGIITSIYGSSTWINGVTNAVIKGAYTGYGAMLSMPVKDGRVSLSSYPSNNNYLYFGYATTALINAGTNSFNKQMYWDAANNNLHADVFTGTLSGNASTATKLTSSAGNAALPIYFSDGKPVACIASSIFSNLSNNGNNLSITIAGLNRTLTVAYASAASKINSRGNLTAYAEGSTTMGESGVNLYTVYNNGYPVTYGNLLHIYGGGAGQLLAEWCGNATLGHLYYRSKRDNSENGWSAWGKIAFVTDNVATASKWITARKITLSGSVTGSVSIDGSEDVILATTTNHTHNWANIEGKPSTFTPSAHTHSYITISTCSTLNENSNNFSVEYAGGNNSVITKPSGVDAFGVMKLRTASGWYGLILMSNSKGIYYRSANGLTSSINWIKLLDSSNSNVSGGGNTWGSSITVNINGISKTLTIPGNPNTDYRVTQSETTTANYRPLVLGYTNVNTAGSGMAGSVTNQVYLSNKFYVQPSTGNLYATNFVGTLSGNAATATTLQTTRTLWGLSFNGSNNVSGNMSNVGLITFSSLSGTNGRALLYLPMADNDFFRIYVGATASDAGYAEIATADDGNEPIYIRQYSGVFSTLVRTLTLLDGSGNTIFPGTVTATTFNGNASTATKLQTARTIWGQSFNGTANVDNTLRIRQTTGNYCEGIRIQTSDGAWSTIILGATADSGTNANAWSIHRKADNNFAISRNSSDGVNGLVMTSTGMGLGTTAPTQRLDVRGNTTITGFIAASSAFINTGDSTLKVYNGKITDAKSDGNICLQTSINGTDGLSHVYPTQYGTRCNLVLQPRGGQVYIGTNPDGGNTAYKLYVNGNVYASSFTGNASSATKLTSSAGNTTLPIYFSDGKPVACTASLIFSNLSNSGNNISVTVAGLNRTLTVGYASNADKVDGYHANKIYNAPSFIVYNSNTSNTYILLATITISGTSLAMAEFTTLFQNRECLDNSSFILSGAIRRNSTTSVSATLSYITLHTGTPRNIYLRSNDGVTFMVYILSAANTWTTYYRAIPIVDSENITYSNIGTTSPIGGSVLNITATKGGNVNYANSTGNADKLDGRHAIGFCYWEGNPGKNNMNDIARSFYSATGMTSLTSSSVDNGDMSGLTHFFNTSYTDGGNGTNSWVFQLACPAGTSNLQFRSRAGGTITNGTAWNIGWTKIIHSGNISSQSVNYATYARYVYCTSGNYLNFQWSGQSGQPTWLWGSNDGANCYVWNPSNFSVYKSNKSDQLEAYTSWGFTDPGRFVRAIRYNGWHTRLYMGYYRDATLENTVHVGYADDADTLNGNHASAFALVGHTHNYDNVYSKLGHTHDDRYYTESEINSKLSAYLPLAGGTMTGLIKGNNKGGSWILGRSNAALYLPRNVQGDWHPVVGFKTKTGSWEFGSVGSDDFATFSWGSDSNYNSGTNTNIRVNLRATNGTIALTSEIPIVTNYYWANMKVSSTSSTSTSPTFSTCYTSNWFRSTGLTGWYNETYAGGWYMTDTTWVRTHNSKGIYTNTGTIYNLGHVWLACNNGYNVGIGTTSPSYKLHVAGDSYTTGWSRAASGFYCQDTGVHFTHNGTKGQIAITSNNEFCWGASSNILYFNYATASLGTTVTLYVWNAGSSSSYASHTMGHITLGNGSYLLKRVGSSSSWYNGRDKAIVRQTSNAGDYCVMMSSKTTSGSWEIGNEYDDLCFTYITDSNYNNRNNNNPLQIWFTYEGIIHTSNYILAAHFYENSDIRYKKILKNLSINSNTIANLPLFDFEWIENNTIGTGTSALAVLLILPNLVSGTDKLTLDYGVLGTIAGITACKELVMLKSELLQLKEKVKLLEGRLRKYENI